MKPTAIKKQLTNDKDFTVATKNRKYAYMGTEAGKAKIATYPLHVAMENIGSKLTSYVTEREKASKNVQLGAVSSLQEVIVTRNDAPTTLSAIKKRLDVVPQEDVGPQFLVGHEWLMGITPSCRLIHVDEALIGKWLDTLDPEKRMACDEVLKNPIWWQGSQEREIFAKPEILLKPEGSGARLIHNGNPLVNVIMGAITNELQTRAVQVLSERNPRQNDPDGLRVFFPCHMNDKQVAELRHRAFSGEGRVIEGDFKSNDATQPAEVRNYEALWYHKLGAPDWYVRATIELRDMTVFSRTLGMKFQIHGQRHSGEEAGTIGNTYNATCIMAGGLLSASVLGGRMLVYGDDTLCWVPVKASNPAVEDVASDLADVVERHGMELEVALPSKTHATFLQTRVYVSPGDVAYPIPKLGRYLSKINVRANNNPDIGDREYMAGKYLSLAHQCRYLPKVSRSLLDTSQALSITPYLEKHHKSARPSTDPVQLTNSITDAWDATSSEVEEYALQIIYHTSASDVLDLVHRIAYTTLTTVAGRDPFSAGVVDRSAPMRAALRAKGIKPCDDLDGPVMAKLIAVDNRDVMNT